MGYADTELAKLLREELNEQIEKGLSSLVKRPNKRIAGRIEAYQAVLGLLDDKFASLNDLPRNQEKASGS